jgi:thioesterase domain-containing protein
VSAGGQLESIFSLSPSQLGMWMHSTAEGGSGLFIEQAAWCLEGPLDTGALARAWQSVSDRHAALRSTILAKGREPVQAVLRHIPVTIREAQAPRQSEDAVLTALMERERTEGFQLNRPPLIRFALLRTAPMRAWWILTFHHIILDGWSLPILWSEATAAYISLIAGTLPRHSPAPDYRRFVSWLKLRSLEAAESFWRNALRGFSTPNQIARSHFPPTGSQPDEMESRMAPSAGAALNAVARDCSASPAIVTEAMWAVVVAGRSRTNDVVFGATVAGRPAEIPGIEAMVGFFINTVPVRLRFPFGATLREVIVAHQRNRADQAEFEYCSAGQIGAWSPMPPDRPLYHTLLVYENLPAPENSTVAGTPVQGLMVREQRLHGGRTTTPLTLLISPGPAPHLRLIYYPTCIAPADVRAVAEDLERIIGNAPEWLDRPVQEYCETITASAAEPADVAPAPGQRPPFVLPRTRLEHQITGIWEELFGRASIGVLDDFFSLGGHSLLALRMAAMIRGRLGIDLPLHSLVTAATIEKQALLLSVGAAADTALVPLASGGTGAPIFCLHPLGGHVLCYASLAKTLSGVHPCWGMQAKGLAAAEEPARNWDEIVDHHWRLLPADSLTRPLVLLGYSYGGYIAMELAVRARLQGHKNISVILLDVPHVSVIPADRLSPDRATLVHSLFGHTLGLDLAALQAMPSEAMLPHVRELAIARHVLPPDLSLHTLDRLLRVAEAHARLQPPLRRYEFPVCLLRARDGWDRISSLPDLGWGEYSCGVKLHWVGGSHETMLDPDHAEDVAQFILAVEEREHGNVLERGVGSLSTILSR